MAGMQKTVQQIPLNFGEEPEVPSPAAKGGNGTGDQHERQYMEAAGVVVRVKSYKNQRPAATANAELFSEEAAQPEPAPAVVDDQAVEKPVETTEVEEPVEDPLTEGPVATLAADRLAPPPVPEAAAVTVAPPRKEQRRTPAVKAAAPKAGPSKRGRKSLKQITAEADLIDIPSDEVLFSKQYYTMGEVSEMFRVNQSLLRFWETEFDILQPKKNKKGDRYFRPVDIKNLHLIYHLLRQKKFTIEGAKDFLRKNKKADERFQVIQRLQEIKSFLLEWKTQL
jgi:DNA-binding transcriptional MerR regulator